MFGNIINAGKLIHVIELSKILIQQIYKPIKYFIYKPTVYSRRYVLLSFIYAMYVVLFRILLVL